MKSMFFVLTFVLTLGWVGVAFANPLAGDIIETDGQLYLHIPNSECPRYEMVARNDDTTAHLRKLSVGDLINASGFLDSAQCKSFIESIEYVGLKKLLGYWYSKAGIITVRDFSSLSFYPMNASDLKDDGNPSQRTGEPITYRYSVTPAEGSEWVVFLSNSKSTSFATIKFTRKNIIMKIYDSENGKILQTLRLSKWGDLKP